MPENKPDADALIEKTRAYVDASNHHDIARIATMLAEDAVYLSTGVGRHNGAAAILDMNKTFFGANPDVHWQTSNYRLIETGGVAFDFVISYAGTSGPGIERVFFDEHGQICRVEVER